MSGFRISADRSWFHAGALLVSFAVAGCMCGPAERAARQLKHVDQAVQEWGTASVSEVLLVKDKGQFSIDSIRTAKEYVDSARTGYQGAASRALERALDLQLALQFSPATLPGASGTSPTLAVADSPTTGNLAVGQMPVPRANRTALGTLSQDRFTTPLSMASPPSSISERQAMLIGLNDKVTEIILRQILHLDGVPANKKIYLGFLQVSCNPGWRTRRGYNAQVSISASYAIPPEDYEKKRGWTRDFAKRAGAAKKDGKTDPAALQEAENERSKIAYEREGYVAGQLAQWQKGKSFINSASAMGSVIQPGRPQPTVLSAFPLSESQVLDLRNSEREQVSVATALAGVFYAQGLQDQGNAMADFAERLETNQATRSQIPIVTSFADGQGFGYTFRPSFQALGDPADQDSGAENVLQPLSIPCMIVLICDEDEVPQTGPWTHFTLTITSRWIPIQSRFWGKRWWTNFTEQSKERNVLDSVKLASRLDEARILMGKAGDAYSNLEWQEIRRNYLNLENAISQERTTALPTDPVSPDNGPTTPTLESVKPTVGWENQQTVIAISGSQFRSEDGKDAVRSVTVGGIPCAFTTVSSKVLIAVVPKWDLPAGAKRSGDIVVGTTAGVAEIRGWTFDRLANDPTDAPDAQATVQRDAAGRITGFTVEDDSGVAARELLDTLKSLVPEAVVQRSGGKVDINFNCP